MIDIQEYTAVFDEETEAIKCGHCGKTLAFFEKNKAKRGKNSRNSQKVIDNSNYFGIIRMKCERCKQKNSLPL